MPGYKDDHTRRVAGVKLMRGMNHMSAMLAKASGWWKRRYRRALLQPGGKAGTRLRPG
ncbi:MAG: hypothetical protein ACRYHQ_21290 [Janthinobacterium lividum]